MPELIQVLPNSLVQLLVKLEVFKCPYNFACQIVSDFGKL